jgi:hypothetical protein
VSESIRVGNTDIGSTTDFFDLLHRQLRGGTPFSGRYDETPEQGALSLFTAVKDTELASRAADAVMRLLTDPDLDVRAGAVAVVQDFPTHFDSSRLLRLLKEHPELYDGVGANHFGRKQPDLAWALMRGMAAVPTNNPAVRDRLRVAAQDVTNGDWLLAGVTANDTEWIISHPAEAVQGDATRAWIVLLNLGNPANRQRFVSMVPKESPALRDAVKAGINRAIRDADERSRLLNALGG